ncbi:MAG: phosphatase PAP2-related protein [Candidatus Pacearchaeota archaeon]|jgi:hypothetical protein
MKLEKEWKKELWENRYLIFLSLVFLILAIVLDYAAGKYVTKTDGVVAPDLILDSIPTINLSFIYVYGAVFFIALLFIYPLFFRVKELHVVISQFSLLVMVRGIFICLTHLEVPTEAVKFYIPKTLFLLNFTNDLFFSGHTAFPFLGYLLFKGEKIRYFFLAMSMIMGAVVLLMHVHYTIDVLSAFFITFGTYKFGEIFFKKMENYFKGHTN